jgi:nucleotide-binding universal stress UspA family protein
MFGAVFAKAVKLGWKMEREGDVRTYLVVIDDTPEAEVALRFAARRAAKTGGTVEVLVVMPRQDFVAWGGVQATIENEALEQAEMVVSRALDMLGAENVARPGITVKTGDAVALIAEMIGANPSVAALVLGAAASTAPGPLVSHFAGPGAGTLPCPLMIIPGSLDREALDRLS